MFKLLKNRNFFLLFTGNLVSQIGSTFYNFGIGWYILTLTSSALQAGLYLGFSGFFSILLVPFLSVYVDRWHKGKILVATDFIRGIFILAGGIVLWFESDPQIILVMLYLVAFILAVNGAFFSPAVSAIIPEIVEDDELQDAFSMNSLIGSIQTLVGVLLAGLFYALIGIFGIFIVNGLSFILSAISEMFIKLKHIKKTKNSSLSAYLYELKDGMNYLVTKKGLMTMLLLIILLNFAVAPTFSNVHPYLFNLILEKPPFHLSLVASMFSLGMIVGGLSVSYLGKNTSIKTSMRVGLAGTMLVFVIHNLLIGWVALDFLSYEWFLGLFLTVSFFFALINMWVNIPINTGLTKAIDPSYRGRVLGLISTFAQGLIPLSLLLTGILLEWLPLTTVLIILTSIAILPFLIFLINKNVTHLLDSLKSAQT